MLIKAAYEVSDDKPTVILAFTSQEGWVAWLKAGPDNAAHQVRKLSDEEVLQDFM